MKLQLRIFLLSRESSIAKLKFAKFAKCEVRASNSYAVIPLVHGMKFSIFGQKYIVHAQVRAINHNFRNFQ